jgi:hypothetical protein
LTSLLTLSKYEEFWKDPSGTPVMWIGLLFAIMCLAAEFQMFRLEPGTQQSSNQSHEQDLQKMVETFREKIAQCLISGNYAKGGPYVLETLMLYIVVEMLASKDAAVGIWILSGTAVQLALHMGYHRDPKHFKEMSVFKGEMRRRVWATIVEADLGISAQMGVPRLIKEWQADTTEPANLQDSDFNMMTTTMPPSRPQTDLTPMLYRIVKARMTATFGSIWDFAVDTRSHPHTFVMEMDKKLQETYASIPECLKWRSMAQCILDSPHIIMQKVYLKIIYQRARIVLHRRYLNCSTTKTPYGHSQQACLDAALSILEYQHMFHEETRPFCRLYQERWRVSSLVNHDFLLATSILCSYLHQIHRGKQADNGEPMFEVIWASLRRSYDIWLHSSSFSEEAEKAANALSVILKSQNDTDTELDVETAFSFEHLSPSSGSNSSYYPQGTCQPALCMPELMHKVFGDATGFGAQTLAFDMANLTSGASAIIEPHGNLEAPVTASNGGWQMLDSKPNLVCFSAVVASN